MRFSLKRAWKDITRHTGKNLMVLYYLMTVATIICASTSMYYPTTWKNWRLMRFYANTFTYATALITVLDLVMILVLIAVKYEEE